MFENIKTEFKEIKDRENAHRCLYWFTLNPELHPVFSETTEEIPLSNQTYITYNTTKKVTLIPSRHTLLLANTPTLRMLILIPSRTDNTSQQTHKRVLFNRYKDYTCYRSKYEINTSRNPISHYLINLNLLSNLNSLKIKILLKLKSVLLFFIKDCCLLSNLNKLLISFKDWSKH